jgi:hypothetical protein
MKRAAKILIIVGLCFIVFGLMVATAAGIAAWTTGATWYDNIRVYGTLAQSHEQDSVSGLTLNLINEPVTIARGGDTVTVGWSQRYDGQYRITQHGGKELSLSRTPPEGRRWGRWPFSINIGRLGRFRDDADIEDGSRRPVTVTIPEGMDLRDIAINGVDIRVTMDNIDADYVEINGVNAVISFVHNDITLYNYETNGIGSSLRVEGNASGAGIGSSSYNHPGAARTVKVNGVNAELNVGTK